MNAVGKICDWVESTLSVLCVIGFIAMFVLGVATVYFRFIVESSLAFPEELILYIFVWLTALGSAVAFRRNAHAAIGVIVDNLPGLAKRIGLMTATSATALFAGILVYHGFQMVKRVSPQISPALEISMAFVYSAVPAGAAFLLLFAIELLIRQATVPASELVADSQ